MFERDEGELQERYFLSLLDRAEELKSRARSVPAHRRNGLLRELSAVETAIGEVDPAHEAAPPDPMVAEWEEMVERDGDLSALQYDADTLKKVMRARAKR